MEAGLSGASIVAEARWAAEEAVTIHKSHGYAGGVGNGRAVSRSPENRVLQLRQYGRVIVAPGCMLDLLFAGTAGFEQTFRAVDVTAVTPGGLGVPVVRRRKAPTAEDALDHSAASFGEQKIWPGAPPDLPRICRIRLDVTLAHQIA
jgi:hypothetical protein